MVSFAELEWTRMEIEWLGCLILCGKRFVDKNDEKGIKCKKGTPPLFDGFDLEMAEPRMV